MRIAFATSDNVHVNSHFGSAKKMNFYNVDKEGYNFVETVEFGGNLKEDGNEDKLVPKVEALTNCNIVYVSDIGKSAASRLIKNKITPIRATGESDKITDLLEELIQNLNGNPPPWLRKIIQEESKTKSFDFEDDDDDE